MPQVSGFRGGKSFRPRWSRQNSPPRISLHAFPPLLTASVLATRTHAVPARADARGSPSLRQHLHRTQPSHTAVNNLMGPGRFLLTLLGIGLVAVARGTTRPAQRELGPENSRLSASLSAWAAGQCGSLPERAGQGRAGGGGHSSQHQSIRCGSSRRSACVLAAFEVACTAEHLRLVPGAMAHPHKRPPRSQSPPLSSPRPPAPPPTNPLSLHSGDSAELPRRDVCAQPLRPLARRAGELDLPHRPGQRRLRPLRRRRLGQLGPHGCAW